MLGYRSKKVAAWFGIGIALTGAFLIWFPLREAPGWIRWIGVPLMCVYLWATPPRSKR